MLPSEFAARLERVADRVSAGNFPRTKQAVAEGGLKLTRHCFDTSTDPYGVSWPGLKRPRPGGPVEVESGNMRDTAEANPTSHGVRFTLPAPYAKFQHEGTIYNPRRLLL